MICKLESLQIENLKQYHKITDGVAFSKLLKLK